MNRPRIAIASGYFLALHVGHARYLAAARELADYLVVVVNNDAQTSLKKGPAFAPPVPEAERVELVSALACVSRAVLAVDADRSVNKTIARLHSRNPHAVWTFCNGGDVLAEGQCREAALCHALGIALAFGVGGAKVRSSTEILAANPPPPRFPRLYNPSLN